MRVDMWFPFYVNDYLGDTMDLTTEEHGVYLLLILQYWKKGFLTDNIAKLKSITKTSDEVLIKGILSEFFNHEDGKYTKNRIEEELERAKKKRAAASENGKKGGRPKANKKPEKSQKKPNGFSNLKPEKNSSQTQSPTQYTNNTDTKNKESVCDENVPGKYNLDMIIEVWNSCENLTKFRGSSLNFKDPSSILESIKLYTQSEIIKSIQNLNKCWNLTDEHKPSTLESYLINSFKRWTDDANPISRYVKADEQEEITEEEYEKLKDIF
jgi:uncharacterized protein YdaU (DUF1376 family)